MKFRWTLDNVGHTPGVYITQLFGEHKMDYSQFGLVGHNGLDIACPRGTLVKAIADGWIIEQTAKTSGFGLRVCQLIISDKTYVAVYGHFQKFANDDDVMWNFFARNRPVKEGDVIGYADSTGFSSGDHVHLGLYQYTPMGDKLNGGNGYGGAIDPMPFMKINLPKWVGYRKSKQKETILTFPDIDSYNKIMSGEMKLTDIFQFGDYEITLPLDKPMI
jgi:murein DD-endopeptidase MepM/ murein hydrolase activator NlpD